MALPRFKAKLFPNGPRGSWQAWPGAAMGLVGRVIRMVLPVSCAFCRVQYSHVSE